MQQTGIKGWFRTVLGGLLGVACSADAGCPELCAKEAQCRQDFGVMGASEQECVDQCEALSADSPDYAEAIAERASCIEEEECDAVVYGYACTAEGD